MLFIFHFIVKCELTANLQPPFYPNEKNRIGFWDIGGDSIINEDYIILAPPIQYQKGYAWNTLPTPYGEWAAEFSFRIAEGTGGGGFAIWLIDQHGADGPFYGGPKLFHGVAFTGSVFVNDSGIEQIKYKLITSNRTEPFEMFKEHEIYDCEMLLTRDPIKIKLYIYENEIMLYNINLKKEEPIMKIAEKKLDVDISQAWLGITAMCDDYTSRIDLLSMEFAFSEYMDNRIKDSYKQQHVNHQPSNIHLPYQQKLRNPSFYKMRRELSNCTNSSANVLSNGTNKDINDIFDVIGEFEEALLDVSTFKQLTEFIHKVVTPYTLSWQKRTFKIVENVNNARIIFSDAFNQTQALFDIFNSSIGEMVSKTNHKIVKLSNLISVDNETDVLIKELEKDVKTTTMVDWLRYFTIFEVMVVVAFSIVQYLPFCDRFLY